MGPGFVGLVGSDVGLIVGCGVGRSVGRDVGCGLGCWVVGFGEGAIDGKDDVVNSGINFNDLIFLRGAEENYFDHLQPNGKYDGFLLSSANCFGKILREICNNVANGNFEDAEKMSEELSDIIRVSFSEGQKLDFGNPFSNVNKAFAHVLINKDNLSCKTCFDRNIPDEFLNDMFLLLAKYNLTKSLNV